MSDNCESNAQSKVSMAEVISKTVLAIFLLVVLLFAFQKESSASGVLPKPSQRVVLNVTGNISKQNIAGGIALDRAMLESMKTHRFKTKTHWDPKPQEFEGVLVSDFLRYTGAKSKDFKATAYDDYQVSIKDVDFDKYPIILAYKLNGKYMSLRNKGPIWLMFPWDDYPELKTTLNHTMSIYQVKEIDIQ